MAALSALMMLSSVAADAATDNANIADKIEITERILINIFI